MSKSINAVPSVLASVTEIVAAHLSNNAVPMADVPAFIRTVHATLSELEAANASAAGILSSLPDSGSGLFRLSDVQPAGGGGSSLRDAHDLRPAVPVEESVQPDYIVCLEDGKRLRMLKRYLMTHFGMTPEDYRARWNLPADYPMAAPEVVEQRRAHAKTAGLGRKPSGDRRPLA